MFAVLKKLAGIRGHCYGFMMSALKNRYFGCKPRVARFTEVAGTNRAFGQKTPC